MISNIFESIKKSLILKLLLILITLLLLLIPVNMVKDLLYERYTTNNEVSEELTLRWGKSQIINGPYIIVPVEKTEYPVATNSNVKLPPVKTFEYIHVTPYQLNVVSEVKTESLQRSIYKANVFESQNLITGSFKKLDHEKYLKEIQGEKEIKNEVEVIININDIRGIKKMPVVKIDEVEYKFALRKRVSKRDAYVLSAKIPTSKILNDDLKFYIDLPLSGSRTFNIYPNAEENTISVKGNWPDPSFKGSFITLDKEINENGFSAKWDITNVLNETPPVFVESSPSSNVYLISELDDKLITTRYYDSNSENKSNHYITIEFFDQVNNYTKSERITKYAVLVIILTFVSIFLSEVYSKVRIHIVNYLLIGLAIVIFYLLLLSISEFVNFNLSYLIASVATILLISSFIRMLVPLKKVSVSIGLILVFIYAFIFVLIQLKEHSLLVGSIGLFLILALLMRFSAKFRLGKAEEENI